MVLFTLQNVRVIYYATKYMFNQWIGVHGFIINVYEEHSRLKMDPCGTPGVTGKAEDCSLEVSMNFC